MTIRHAEWLFTRYCLKRLSFLALIFLFINLMAGCGSSKFRIPDPIPNDMAPVLEPKFQKINLIEDALDKVVAEQIRQSFDLSRQLRNLFGKRKPAMNVNAFDEVPNSSWFTNRNHIKRMSLEGIARGPNAGAKPDPSAAWTVISAKAEGVTPGFTIKDEGGNRFIIKFDPTGFSEMATGAEVVSTKLFYAAGYHAPENYVVYFHPNILKLGKEVSFTDKKGRKRFMEQADLDEILQRIKHLPDGRVRAAASKFIPGKPKGPFRYIGTRKDDPNDIIPHQHRRELRGLRVIAAWLNHFDTKASNSFTSYAPEGYIKHYLLDFGSTLGSQGNEPMQPDVGHENKVDPQEVFKSTVTLGLYVRPWEKVKPIEYPSIGYFRSDIFRPQKYKFLNPNPAFESMTHRDGYWGAKIVMSFTDEQIKAVVAEGQYSDPEAADYLFKIITERRDIIGRYWFTRMNPLDKFELRETADGKQTLCFVDLAVESGLESAARYRYGLSHDAETILASKEIEGRCIPLPTAAPGTDGALWGVKIQTQRGSSEKWSKWVKAYLRVDDRGKFTLVGVRRQE